MKRTLEPRSHEVTKEGFCATWARQTYFSCLRVFVVTALVFLFIMPALAVLPDERLADPALEARARTIGQELRCVVCRNQSIDDSNADLAHDLRVLVRERLIAGDSDTQVLAYITSRYGDYVLLRPPIEPKTWLLWFGPPVLLLIGGLVILLNWRRRRADALVRPAPLSTDEQARLARLMKEGG
ncbi:MAG TPA: cytochrome c-type biogenesis protein [Stellaceae bacterium]|jgi:cytochrome c-type biogenesis protein CcmH|nr:cytochrome c-type biogenesis protein [Stellaceae bacterium]